MKRDLMIGRRFGRLIVLGDAGAIGYTQRSLVRCDCGVEKIVRDLDIRHGKINSCGCLKNQLIGLRSRTHGMSKSPEYTIWHDMKRRCYDPKNKEYAHYGASGITVCERWKTSFQNFFDDMGARPSVLHSVERLNNSQGYSLENCKWALPQEQANNKRNNRWIEFSGRTQTIAQWARELGMDWDTLDTRFRRGWSTEDALTLPLGSFNSKAYSLPYKRRR